MMKPVSFDSHLLDDWSTDFGETHPPISKKVCFKHFAVDRSLTYWGRYRTPPFM
jgi:hypothetical protein